MAARLVDELAELLLGMAIFVDQPLIGLRLLDRVEVLALDILDQRDFERFVVAELADDRRDFVQPRPLRRAPAPLAGDDLEAVAVRADDDRLDDAARLDRGGELVQRLFVEDGGAAGRDAARCSATGIIWIAAARRLRRRDRRFLGDLAEQRGEAAAEAGRALRGGTDRRSCRLRLRLGRRSISSRASAI